MPQESAPKPWFGGTPKAFGLDVLHRFVSLPARGEEERAALRIPRRVPQTRTSCDPVQRSQRRVCCGLLRAPHDMPP